MIARFRHPRRSATIAAYLAVYLAFALLFVGGWGVVFLLWQVVRLAVAYPDLATMTAATLVVAYATAASWRQTRQRELFDTESTRSEW